MSRIAGQICGSNSISTARHERDVQHTAAIPSKNAGMGYCPWQSWQTGNGMEHEDIMDNFGLSDIAFSMDIEGFDICGKPQPVCTEGRR